jgi:hypothetical protein
MKGERNMVDRTEERKAKTNPTGARKDTREREAAPKADPRTEKTVKKQVREADNGGKAPGQGHNDI